MRNYQEKKKPTKIQFLVIAFTVTFQMCWMKQNTNYRRNLNCVMAFPCKSVKRQTAPMLVIIVFILYGRHNQNEEHLLCYMYLASHTSGEGIVSHKKEENQLAEL
jgi:hypothetical protein